MANTDPDNALTITNRLLARTEGVYKYQILRLKLLCEMKRKKEAMNVLRMLKEGWKLHEGKIRDIERGIEEM